MTALAVTPKCQLYKVELTNPIQKSLRLLVGGTPKIVRPLGLPRPFCFFCNDNFHALGLAVNPIGCHLYGTLTHGCPICGTLVIMKEVSGRNGAELAGLDEAEQTELEDLCWDLIRRDGDAS